MLLNDTYWLNFYMPKIFLYYSCNQTYIKQDFEFKVNQIKKKNEMKWNDIFRPKKNIMKDLFQDKYLGLINRVF